MTESDRRNRIWRLLTAALLIAGLWAFWRWALPVLLPFLLGLCIAKLIEKPVRWLMERANLKRWLASLCVTIGLLAFLALLAYLLFLRLMYESARLLRQLPELMTKLPAMSRDLSLRLETIIVAAPADLQEFLRGSADKLLNEGVSVPTELYAWLAGAVAGAAGFFPTAMLFFVAMTLSLYFISSDYPGVTRFLMRQLPERWRQRVIDSKNHMLSTLGKWLKAQGLLVAITAGQTLVGLMILRADYALLFTGIIAVVDALPVVGSGMVLVPWSVFCLLTGETHRGIGLLVLWLIVTTVRNAAEPRLVGSHIGLHPLVSLLSMYAGFTLMGVFGMILFPFAAILLVQLQEWGYIRLWK